MKLINEDGSPTEAGRQYLAAHPDAVPSAQALAQFAADDKKLAAKPGQPAFDPDYFPEDPFEGVL